MPLNIDFLQVLLHLFNFVILSAGLYLLLYKPVKGFMDQREAAYAQKAQEAEERIAEAMELRRTYEEQLAGLEKEMDESRRSLRMELEAERQEELEKAREKAEQIVKKAAAEARLEHERMMIDVNRQTGELAEEATKRLLGRSTSDLFDDFLDLSEEAIAAEGLYDSMEAGTYE